jgi:ComF family protein
MRLKFSGNRSVAEALAPFMAAAVIKERSPPRDTEPVVTWVPLGRRRKRVRGFDQAEALARSLAGVTGWPARQLLRRVVETTPQARRAGAERKMALSGAFVATAPSPERVVLVDDVLTSGTTAAECATVLHGAGAKEVGVLSAARSLGGPVPLRCYNPPGLQPGSVVAREIASR